MVRKVVLAAALLYCFLFVPSMIPKLTSSCPQHSTTLSSPPNFLVRNRSQSRTVNCLLFVTTPNDTAMHHQSDGTAVGASR
jgi:hypothetical protein